MFSINGPPKGYNTTSNQSSYDLVFKDVVINYTNPVALGGIDKYTVNLNLDIDKIYKAELVTGLASFVSDPYDPGNNLYVTIPDTVRKKSVIVDIPQLNNRTVNIPLNNNAKKTIGTNIFCQIPDNYTPLGGQSLIDGKILLANSITTFIGGPPFTAEQVYNPPISNINKLDNIHAYI